MVYASSSVCDDSTLADPAPLPAGASHADLESTARALSMCEFACSVYLVSLVLNVSTRYKRSSRRESVARVAGTHAKRLASKVGRGKRIVP